MIANTSGGNPGAMYQPGMGPGGRTTSAPPSLHSDSATNPDGTYYAPSPEYIQDEQNVALAQRAYTRALGRFNQQRGQLLTQYGYRGNIDPTTGLISGLGVDPTAVYGSYQQLLHNNAAEDEQAKNAAEERGLVGGLANQAASELHYGHGAATTDLVQQLMSALNDINGQQSDAKGTVDDAIWEAAQQAARDAASAGDFNPANPDSGSGGGSSGGGSNPKARKVVSMIGSIPTGTANQLVRAAIAKGEPVSEHGLGQMRSPTHPAKRKPIPNFYTTGRKKRG